MRVSDVRKRYPEFFETVEAAVWDDARRSCREAGCKDCIHIAYNAAAVATLELHKIMMAKKRKPKAAAKKSNTK